MANADATRRCPSCDAVLARDHDLSRCAKCQRAEADERSQVPEVPASFWEDDDMRAALASRHMGEVIRAYRQHMHHGRRPLSQDDIAVWAGKTQPSICRIETGPAPRDLDRLIQWARLLGIPQEYLWFTLPADDDAGESAAPRTPRLVPSEPEPSAEPESPHLAEVVDTLATAILCPARAPEGVDEPNIDTLARRVQRAWELRQRSNYAELGSLLSALLASIEQAAAEFDGDDREQALRLVVHTYNAASSLLKKLDDTQLGLTAADRAVRVAKSVGDPILIAAASYRLANVLLVGQRLGETQAVALDAASAIEPGRLQTTRSLAMWGGLQLTAAVAAGRAGDETAAWELLGEARAASRMLQSDYADLYSIFGPTNVAIHGVQVAVELGNGHAAVERAKRVDPDSLPANLLERRSHFLIDVAHGHVLEQNDIDAVATLVRAEATAPEEVRLSSGVHRLLRTMLGRERKGAVPGLRDLADRIDIAC